MKLSYSNVRRSLARILGVLTLTGMCITTGLQAAPNFLSSGPAPAAGSSIGNQASATYTDASNTPRTVTSNVVVAVVQQVASVLLSSSSSRTVAVGSQVAYPLTLTNTGNGTDTFALTFMQSGAFNFSSVTFYADANGDGIADDSTAITSTPALAMGATFRFVVVGTVPSTVSPGSANDLLVTATSAFDAGATSTVSEGTTVTSNAVVAVTQSISASTGLPGSGPYTITLTYNNSGNTAATDIQLRDLLPTGMTYVANSARWSATGTTVLTDANNADSQGSGPTIVYDYGVTVPGQVTATISTLSPGQAGTLTFQVMIDAFDTATVSGQLAGVLNNTPSYSYNDGASNIASTNTNTSGFTVSPVSAVTIAGDTVANALQGSTVTFINAVRNTGNASDTFDITVPSHAFPAGTAFQLYQADGVTPLLDTNGNGVPDTGAMASGAIYNVVLTASLPTSASGGPYTVNNRATSTRSTSATATTTNTLTSISANSVDLTNNAAIGGAGVAGVGSGPEGSAQATNAVLPGATTRFSLFVNNTSATSDTYDLSASTNSSFATLTLPAGWTVVFRDASNATITNTGVVNAGASRQVFADVTVPPNQGAIPSPGQAIYFRALSPTSGSSDRNASAVVVSTVRALQILPNNTAQVVAGNQVVFSHTLTNTGNVTENAGASSVTLVASSSQSGFSTVVYRDVNANGVIDAGDVVINAASDLGAIPAGASVNLLVRATAPSGAAPGTINTITLTLTPSGTVNDTASGSAVSATDTVTVIAGTLVLVKEQAIDAACDGTPDAAFGNSNISAGATPGACLRYRITLTNHGTSDVLNVTVNDATPASTTYHAVVPAAVSQGSVTTPLAAASGSVSGSIGTLAPSASATMTFGVRINP